MYIRILVIMVRMMKATITRIASVAAPLGNSGHVIVPKTCREIL
jgi:putative transposon-encoded protein